MLGEGWVHLNHGAFGTIPRTVFAAYTELLAQVEVSPDKWFVYDQYGMVRCSRERLAGLINCSPEEVVLVENATTGVNTVLRSLQLHEGDGLLITSLSYPGVSNTAIAVCQQSGATLHTLEVPFPIESKESVVQLYRSYLDAHPDVKVAVVDHISSPAPILQPVKEVAEVCHKRGVKVLVDGAHGPGQLHLDMRELDVDYYTGEEPAVTKAMQLSYIECRCITLLQVISTSGYSVLAAVLCCLFARSSRSPFILLWSHISTLMDSRPASLVGPQGTLPLSAWFHML